MPEVNVCRNTPDLLVGGLIAMKKKSFALALAFVPLTSALAQDTPKAEVFLGKTPAQKAFVPILESATAFVRFLRCSSAAPAVA